MAKEKATAPRNIIVLLVVALVSVSLLAVLNQVTMDPIAQAEAEARAAVYRSVYADAADFEEIDLLTSPYSDWAPTDESVVLNAVLKAKDDGGQNVGYVIDVTSKNGYGGDVQMAVGITNEGEITAFSVVSHSETPGLGARATESEFADQFSGLSALTAISFSKTGANRDNNEIDAISGATITTTAVTNAVNQAIALFNDVLKGV